MISATAKIDFSGTKIVRAANGGFVQGLRKLGAFVTRRAQTSMRYRNKPSKPGEPPSAHKGTIRKLIFWAVEDAANTLVAGPIESPKPTYAPMVLEHGGTTQIKNPRRRKRTLGKSGEIRIVSKQQLRRYRKQRTNRSWLKKTKTGKWVAYGRLKTPAEVARANALNEELYGPWYLRDIQIKRRAFMEPAAQKELAAEQDRLWKNSIKE